VKKSNSLEDAIFQKLSPGKCAVSKWAIGSGLSRLVYSKSFIDLEIESSFFLAIFLQKSYISTSKKISI
jgi:hypothetical protein